MKPSNSLPLRLNGCDWLRMAAVVLALNIAYLASLLLAAAIPAETLRERVVEAFESGALAKRDKLAFDSGIGWHQYNDCLILQMVSNAGNALPKAAGPLAYYRDDFRDMCRMVSELVNHEIEREQLESFHYTRYWHGHNALTALMLYVWDFANVRTILKTSAYLSLLGLAIVALRSHAQLRILGMGIAMVGGLFWGLPYFAQSPSHGPGNIAIVLGFIALIALARQGLTIGRYVILCGAFGSLLVYMEFLTGLLPTAAAFLLPLGYFAPESLDTPRRTIRHRWRFALAGLVAFGVGTLLTVLAKQVLAVSVFGWEVVDAFTNNLDFYTDKPQTGLENRLLVSAYTVVALIGRWGTILTYGSVRGAHLLFGTSALVWIVALILAGRSRSPASISSFAACAAGASLIFLWIILLPTHTFNHAYMVRMMIAPLALGWIALLLQMNDQNERRKSGALTDATGTPERG